MTNLIKRSLQLDIEFLQLPLPLLEKLTFILRKYFVLFLEFIPVKGFGQRNTTVFGKKYYYDDKYGLAVLQGTFIDNDFLKHFIKPGSVVIDVGANIGQFNLFCKNILKTKRVYSFEPVEQTFSILKKNCASNVYNFAVTSRKNLTIFIGELSVWASSFKHNDNSEKILVKGIKLDAYPVVQREKVIDLFKIDTEGAEMDVLKVSKKVIKKSRYILVEMPFVRKADADMQSITAFLREIVPTLKVVRIGRVYNNELDGTTGAADILFHNPAIK